ncbi:MAG: carbohydrate ABC transporter permease [Caldilinea sp. CFX5]|nr:carbohydrate ABC transporter permease [Caldilinea sp. CFX5]
MQAIASRHSTSAWHRARREFTNLLLFLLTALLALSFLFPFAWSLSSSLKTGFEVIAYPPALLPKAPQWYNYVEAWTAADLGRFFWNSTVVTGLSLIGQVVSSFIVAYGFARFRFPGREFLFVLCLSGLMMPVYVTIIPLFTMFRALGWINTFKPLIIPTYFGSAFAIFLLRQFIMSIPLDFDESALIDGASRWTILTRIITPNCQPALATVAIVGFMTSWNAFLGPLIFLDSVKNYTLPLGLWFLRGTIDDALPRDHLLMAGAMITTFPVLLIFVLAQNYFIEGIVMSGIKG